MSKYRNQASLLSLLLIILMIVALMGFNGLLTAAGEEAVTVYIPQVPVEPGKNFVLPVRLKSTGTPLAGIQLDIAYNPDLIAVNMVEEEDMLNPGHSVLVPDITKGDILGSLGHIFVGGNIIEGVGRNILRMAFTAPENFPANGVLCKISFTAGGNVGIADLAIENIVARVLVNEYPVLVNSIHEDGQVIIRIPLESIKIQQDTVRLLVNKEEQLIWAIEPANGTVLAADFSWSSSNPDIATVDSQGVVRGIAAGRAEITVSVTTVDGTFMDSCEITVVVPVESVNFAPSSLELFPGETDTLFAVVSPPNATNKQVDFKTDDVSGAIINIKRICSSRVEVTAVGDVGASANVTVTTEDGGFTDVSLITIVAEPDVLMVLNVEPSDMAENVPLNQQVVLYFNLPLTAGGTYDTGITLIAESENEAPLTKTIDRRKLVLIPDALQPDTNYTLTVDQDAVKYGNTRLAGDFITTFRTGAVSEAYEPLTGITLNTNNVRLLKNGPNTMLMVPALVPPEYQLADVSFKFVSSNNDIARVSVPVGHTGPWAIIDGLSPGLSQITVTATGRNGERVTAVCNVEVFFGLGILLGKDLDVNDVILLMRSLVGKAVLNEIQLKAARVSGGEKPSIGDVVLMLRRIVNLHPNFPDE